MNPEYLTRLLALALYKLEEPLVVSKELLEKMTPVQIILDDQTDPLVLSLTVKSGEVLIGKVLDNDVVEVIV